VAALISRYYSADCSVASLCDEFDLSPSTLYRLLDRLWAGLYLLSLMGAFAANDVTGLLEALSGDGGEAIAFACFETFGFPLMHIRATLFRRPRARRRRDSANST
jgi:hypothetical protein